MATTNAGNSRCRDGKRRFRSDKAQGEKREIKDFKGKNNFKSKSDFKSKNNFKAKDVYSKGYDKDKDEEDKPVRRPKQTKSDSKPKEQQPDKFEIINRLEKEKKAMKKKYDESKKENRSQRHQMKPKRSGNVDWTREYENGSYDDDDLDMYY